MLLSTFIMKYLLQSVNLTFPLPFHSFIAFVVSPPEISSFSKFSIYNIVPVVSLKQTSINHSLGTCDFSHPSLNNASRKLLASQAPTRIQLHTYLL